MKKIINVTMNTLTVHTNRRWSVYARNDDFKKFKIKLMHGLWMER